VASKQPNNHVPPENRGMAKFSYGRQECPPSFDRQECPSSLKYRDKQGG
jgi:hypothetical protein